MHVRRGKSGLRRIWREWNHPLCSLSWAEIQRESKESFHPRTISSRHLPSFSRAKQVGPFSPLTRKCFKGSAEGLYQLDHSQAGHSSLSSLRTLSVKKEGGWERGWVSLPPPSTQICAPSLPQGPSDQGKRGSASAVAGTPGPG